MLATLATRVSEAKSIYISETLNIEYLPTKHKAYRKRLFGNSWCYGNDSSESVLAPCIPCNLFEGDCLAHVFKKYCVIASVYMNIAIKAMEKEKVDLFMGDTNTGGIMLTRRSSQYAMALASPTGNRGQNGQKPSQPYDKIIVGVSRQNK
jgi:hypothetical protein